MLDTQYIINKITEVNNRFELSFSSELHRYTSHGVKLFTSVTSLVSDKFDFTKIPNIEYYAQIGTNMHQVCEDSANFHINGLERPDYGDPIYNTLYDNVREFHLKHKPILAEQIIMIDRLNYEGFEHVSLGGMIDLLCELNGKLTIVDYKTSKQLQPAHKAQINVYAKILKYIYGVEVEELRLVKIDKGTAKLSISKIELWSDAQFVDWLNNQLGTKLEWQQ